MKPTIEQQEAIDFEGSNILVSAGAGSGKTAVLTKRIIRKLNSGLSLDNLVVITFTKAAANEMKHRVKEQIIAEINNGAKLEEELKKVETANITTFDAYSLNLLKTYHYKLGIPKDIKIGEGLIFTIKINEIIEEYFNNNLDSQLISHFAIGGTSQLYEAVRDSYYKYSININYQFNKDDLIEQYFKILKNELVKIEYLVGEIQSTEPNDFTQLYSTSLQLDGEELYYSLVHLKNCKLEKKRGKSSENEIFNQIVEEIRKNSKDLFDYIIHTEYKHGQLQNEYENTFAFLDELEIIFNYIEKELMAFKREKNIFDFIDISKLVIELIENNHDVRDIIKNNINEVLIDEYQDTVSYQDYLVSLITENNIFMVGDVKQAIYGFRNATPKSFNSALKDERCKKIFLNKNFRSSEKILGDINDIFEGIMTEESGGVDYNDDQKLYYGNKSFDKIESGGISYLKYLPVFERHEEEAQLVANDIKRKIESINILDNSDIGYRKCNEKDFAILCRSKTQFDLYTKTLIKNNINVNVYSDVVYSYSFEIILIKNLFKLYLNNNDKVAKASILRSFIFEYTDQEIAHILETNDMTPFVGIEYDDKLNSYQLYNRFLNDFKVLQKIRFLDDPSDAFVRLKYTFDLMENFDALNYSIEEIIAFFDSIKKMDKDITFSYEKSADLKAVTIMTIHKSKGLEFPIVYMPGIDKKFSIDDLKAPIIFDQNFGTITQNYYKENGLTYKVPVYKNMLFKEQYISEMMAEEMRLLYVAMTRAKQELVLIVNANSIDENKNGKSKTYMQWLAKYCNAHSLEEVNTNIKEEQVNQVQVLIPLHFEQLPPMQLKIEEIKRASQLELKEINEEEKALIQKGNDLHRELEFLDFNNLENSENPLAQKLLIHDIFKNIKNYYTEFEFIDNGIHGIIDLLIENDDEVIIIDHKLSNIDKPEYLKQMEIYKKYVSSISEKTVSCYLYSIMKNELKKI